MPQAKRGTRAGDVRRWQKGGPWVMSSATYGCGCPVKTVAILACTCVIGAMGAASLAAQKPSRPTPTLVGTPGAATPATPQTTAKTPRHSPTLQGTPGAAAPAAAAAQPTGSTIQTQAAHPVAGATFTAGLAVEPFEGDSAALGGYLRRYTLLLDSSIVTLVNVFRNTSGQPLAGASEPSALSARERDRWDRCRNVHWDLQSYVTAMHDLLEGLPENAAVQHAGGALDTALTAMQATAACDDVASMVAAPDRWAPWGQNYQATARRFYSEWYGQVRDVQEKNRAFIVAVNATRPANDRISVPAALPHNPPYAGATPGR
jgi:hypothetical protein